MSDRASKALAEASLPGEPRTYRARSKRSGVPLSTLIIVRVGDARKNRRPKANSISLHRKRKPSKHSPEPEPKPVPEPEVVQTIEAQVAEEQIAARGTENPCSSPVRIGFLRQAGLATSY